jgi:acyl transferase domain-containing protein
MSLIAFLFPGQASVVPGAVAALAAAEPAAAHVVDAAQDAHRRHFGQSLDCLTSNTPPRDLPSTQLMHVATSVAVYRVLSSRRARPNLLIGHSLGEISALCAADVMSPEQAMDVVCLRVKALQDHSGVDGTLVAVSTNRAKAESIVTLAGEGVTLASINGPDQCVLSVVESARQRLESLLHASGVPSARLNAPFPFHGPALRDVAERFSRSLEGFRFSRPAIPIHSPIFGPHAWNDPLHVPALLARALLEPVDFEASVRAAFSLGVTCFVECGALRALTALTGRILGGETHLRLIAPITSTGDPVRGVLEAAAAARQDDGMSAQAVTLAKVRELLAKATALLTSLDATVPETVLPKNEPALDATRLAADPQLPHADMIELRASAADQVTLEASASVPPRSSPATLRPTKDEILPRLIAVLQRITEYPPDVFEPNAEFEADLGIDSLKQVEVFTAVQNEFGLSNQPGLKLRDYNTLARVAALVSADLGV